MSKRLPVRVAKILSLVTTLFFCSFQSFAADVTVMHPYVRAVPSGQANSAAFMVLKNSSHHDRALVAAHSNISKAVELHTHRMEDGMMRMRRIDKITIKPGQQTELKPGGLHVMFIGLQQPLSEGDMVELELVFDNGEHVGVSAPVKKVVGMGHMKKQH